MVNCKGFLGVFVQGPNSLNRVLGHIRIRNGCLGCSILSLSLDAPNSICNCSGLATARTPEESAGWSSSRLANDDQPGPEVSQEKRGQEPREPNLPP